MTQGKGYDLLPKGKFAIKHHHYVSIEQYIEFWHSRSGFSRQRMGRERAERFDEELRRLVLPHASGGMLRYDVSATLAWGVPRRG